MAATPTNLKEEPQLFRDLPCPIKLLKDLKVTDLRFELGIRGLDTTGVKAVLTDRLQKYLQEQDHDIGTFDFNSAEDILTLFELPGIGGRMDFFQCNVGAEMQSGQMKLKDLQEIIGQEEDVTSDQFFIYNDEGKEIVDNRKSKSKSKSKPKNDQLVKPQLLPIIFYVQSAMKSKILPSKTIREFFCQEIDKNQLAQIRTFESRISPSFQSKIKEIRDARDSMTESGPPVPEWFSHEDDDTEIVECKLKVKLPDIDAKKAHARLVGDYALSSPSHVNGEQRVWKQVEHGPKPNFIWYDKEVKCWMIGKTLRSKKCSIYSADDTKEPEDTITWKYATKNNGLMSTWDIITKQDEVDARRDVRAERFQSKWDTYDEDKKRMATEFFKAQEKAKAEGIEEDRRKIHAIYAEALAGTEEKTDNIVGYCEKKGCWKPLCIDRPEKVEIADQWFRLDFVEKCANMDFNYCYDAE